MPHPQTRSEIIEHLAHVQAGVVNTVQQMPAEQFNLGTDVSWSAADYLKHLILSVKPLARALNISADDLRAMFGQPDHASRSYEEVVTLYKARLAEGFRAEDSDRVVPVFYRFPEGVTDEQSYLAQTWDESNSRLIAAVQQWDEAALDDFQLPHPAVGLLTLREMLFFTVHHNTLHWQDIQQAGG